MAQHTDNTKIWTVLYIDQPVPFWEMLFDRYNKLIKSVYVSLPGFPSGSERPLQRVSLFEPKQYFHVLDHYVHKRPLLPHEIGVGPSAIHFPLEITKKFCEYTDLQQIMQPMYNV